jgi:hypothetical protein
VGRGANRIDNFHAFAMVRGLGAVLRPTQS